MDGICKRQFLYASINSRANTNLTENSLRYLLHDHFNLFEKVENKLLTG
jgi:hypothetical protein